MVALFGKMLPLVSIHASVKDATRQKRAIAAQKEVSIHASVKDATQCNLGRVFEALVSIHASVKDATQFI